MARKHKKRGRFKIFRDSVLASPARFERTAFRLGGERSILLSYGDNIQLSSEFSYPNHPLNSTLLILFYQTRQGMSSKTPAKIT